MELLKMTNDFVFKSIFGDKKNKHLLEAFLSAVLDRKIKVIEIRSDEYLKRVYADDKLGIIDIKAVLESKEIVNIEMQMYWEYNIYKRAIFYAEKLQSDIEAGQTYKHVRQLISIFILGQSLNEFDDYHASLRLVDQKGRTLPAYDLLRFHFIQLSKLEESDSHKSLWLQFLKSHKEEVFEMLAGKDENIKEAYDQLKEISGNPETKRLAELREKYLMDKRSNEEAIKEKALKQGRLEERVHNIIMILNSIIPEAKGLIPLIEVINDLDLADQVMRLVLKKDVKGIEELLKIKK
ncbi:Rpn family recombination-promoting nuclease/putative transposase [Acidaminobacter sp. JC074]|uniref:Rpn family recombination-promoting nuclease/putative transposase n=1 Tax=Acidaminobacter sp. JC074 TaxID=2530199 RepID=UPI001F0EA678|nr:Rpn family recombination-promoting nuclease/putative transposase [Acidaminobacter sp. JC074]MCH4888571.1 Rpn family recombination-promoting nuclease/putative transposase [Acidaminobacter sp. JC074]